MTEVVISTPALAEHIAERARASLSYYCMFECKAMCCRKGFITLNKEETFKIVGKNELLSGLTGDYTVDLSNGCPKLKNNKCTIYKERPKICRDYPVFVRHFAVHFSEKCPAVMEGKLYPFETELIQMGMRVLKI